MGRGDGLNNTGTIDILTITASGHITGGAAGATDSTTSGNAVAGTQGYGVYNAGGATITDLINLGTISGSYDIYNLGTIGALTNAGGDKKWRAVLEDLAKKSQAARVSGIWLLLSYFLATLGELCLSPVGLSMVTKLAPPRFASLFMGVWLLSSSVAQYVGGSIGENWGIWTPTYYFNVFVATSAVGAVLLFVLVRPIKRLMHGVD